MKKGLLNKYLIKIYFFLFSNSVTSTFLDTNIFLCKTNNMNKSITKDNKYDL